MPVALSIKRCHKLLHDLPNYNSSVCHNFCRAEKLPNSEKTLSVSIKGESLNLSGNLARIIVCQFGAQRQGQHFPRRKFCIGQAAFSIT